MGPHIRVSVLPQDVSDRVDAFLDDPSSGVRRSRPARTESEGYFAQRAEDSTAYREALDAARRELGGKQ